jgi:hypothetical protein
VALGPKRGPRPEAPASVMPENAMQRYNGKMALGPLRGPWPVEALMHVGKCKHGVGHSRAVAPTAHGYKASVMPENATPTVAASATAELLHRPRSGLRQALCWKMQRWQCTASATAELLHRPRTALGIDKYANANATIWWKIFSRLAGLTAEVHTTPPRRGAALGVRRTQRTISNGNARAPTAGCYI